MRSAAERLATEARKRAQSRRWDLAARSVTRLRLCPDNRPRLATCMQSLTPPTRRTSPRQSAALDEAWSGRGSGARRMASRGHWPLLHGASSASTRSWSLHSMARPPTERVERVAPSARSGGGPALHLTASAARRRNVGGRPPRRACLDPSISGGAGSSRCATPSAAEGDFASTIGDRQYA